ncbi:MAG: class I SAM-dependent methyltransferase [Candidatus Omnitrophica bacterium]|nr:class I SAM-dependent methyltransferase [Candidatus Omnitrophota bacterium]
MKNELKNVIKKSFYRIGWDVSKVNKIPQTDFDVDREFHEQYEKAMDATNDRDTDNLLKRQRHHTLYNLLKKADIHAGQFAECGCFRGLSAYQTAAYLQEKGFKNTFYIFDSFEGLSEYEEKDLPGGQIDIEQRRKHFSCSLETVQNNLREFLFIRYEKGWIPKRFSQVADETFAFVHIDVDMYQPIKDSLEFFYPRVVENGIIVFDDYGCLAFPGAKKAVDEFMKDKNDLFLPLPSGEAFLVKR